MRGQKVSLQTLPTDRELKIVSLVEMQEKINRSSSKNELNSAEDDEQYRSRTRRWCIACCEFHDRFFICKNVQVIKYDDDGDDDDDFEVANDVANDYYRKKHGLPLLKATRGKPFSPMIGTQLEINGSKHSLTPGKKYLYFPDAKKTEKASPAYRVNKLCMTPELKNNSTAEQIFNFLFKKKTPIHINEIIYFLNKKKCLNKQSRLHHYALVHKVLMRNHFFFKKEEKGMFSLRDGFKDSRRSVKKSVSHKKQKVKPAISLSDIVILTISAFEKKIKKKAQLTPSEILALLKSDGYCGNYREVKRSLKPELFRRRGLKFQIKK